MRILLTFYILAVLFVTGVVLGCAWGLIDIIHPRYWLDLLAGNAAVIWITSVIGVAMAVVSIMLMFSGVRKRRPKTALVRTTDGGAISITVSAVEEMATRHIAAHEGIRSVRVKVVIRDAGANISARLSVAEGTNIPDVLLALQTSLKEHIELLSGLKVNKTLLLVEKTAQVAKARVE